MTLVIICDFGCVALVQLHNLLSSNLAESLYRLVHKNICLNFSLFFH